MWIFLEGGRFLSIVADPDQPHLLRVRARLPGDIETDFPEVEIEETAGEEYRYLARIPRERVMAALREELAALAYPSLRRTICNRNRVTLAHRCADALREAQQAARAGEGQESLCHPPSAP